MQNLDDRIILDEEVEVKYEEKPLVAAQQKEETVNYSNKNIYTTNIFGTLFSKKYIALTLSSLAIILTLFMKFIMVCGATSLAFYGIWFFLCAGCSATALILNIISYAKNKKVDFNVSTIITILSLLFLFLI